MVLNIEKPIDYLGRFWALVFKFSLKNQAKDDQQTLNDHKLSKIIEKRLNGVCLTLNKPNQLTANRLIIFCSMILP